jgi:hypothetical protein
MKKKFKLVRVKLKHIKKNNIMYSQKNNRRKEIKPISVLKPQTSSLSPSIKSKGVLDQSDRQQKKKIK